MIHGWRASAPSPHSPPPRSWGGDTARLNGERGGGGARRPPAASGPQGKRALPPPVGTRPPAAGLQAPRPRGRSGLLAPHCVSGGRPARPHLALPPLPAARPALGRALPGAAGLGGAGERCRPRAAHAGGRRARAPFQALLGERSGEGAPYCLCLF